VPLLLALHPGCGQPEPAGDGDPTAPTAPTAVDPLAEALGGCIATIEDDDQLSGEQVATKLREHDENGDAVRISADYVDDERFYDYVLTQRFDPPHEMVEAQVRFTRTDIEGWDSRYEYDGGDFVWGERDLGPDGDIDQTQAYAYEDHKRIHAEYDDDGDGTVDDAIDYVWSPDGDGWSVVGDGIDRVGPYQVVEHRDAELREVSYHYEDGTGLTIDWEVTERSVLGFTGDYASETRQDGDLLREESEKVRFDEFGREIRRAHEITEYNDGRATGRLSRVERSTWDCP
jgi:hypothetical protein